MKLLFFLCFATGIVIGWWQPRTLLTVGAADRPQEMAKNERRNAPGQEVAGREAIRRTAEGVAISRERLEALLALDIPPALSSGDFGTDEGNRILASFKNLADWCGLSGEEKMRLAAIIRQAADSREAWVKANVKAEANEAGHWSLDFPGDEGKPKAELKRQIEEAFAPQKAAAIELGADLDHFFGLGRVAPDFTNGRVEIRVVRTRPDSTPDPAASQLSVDISTEGRSIGIEYQMSQQRFYEQMGPFHELIAWDELVAGATEAAKGK